MAGIAYHFNGHSGWLDLARLARDKPKFHFHYVTAREMVNLIKAAESGYQGPVAGALDWELVSNLAQG